MIDCIDPIHRPNPDPYRLSRAERLGIKRKQQFEDVRSFEEIVKEVRARNDA